MNLGKITVQIRRMQSYAALASSLMVATLWFDRFGWKGLLLAPPALILFYFIWRLDTDRIHAQDQEYQLNKSRSFRELCENVKRIGERYDEFQTSARADELANEKSRTENH